MSIIFIPFPCRIAFPLYDEMLCGSLTIMMLDELKVVPHSSAGETKWKISHYFAVHGKMADVAVRQVRDRDILQCFLCLQRQCVSLSRTTMSTAVMSLWSMVKSLELHRNH